MTVYSCNPIIWEVQLGDQKFKILWVVCARKLRPRLTKEEKKSFSLTHVVFCCQSIPCDHIIIRLSFGLQNIYWHTSLTPILSSLDLFVCLYHISYHCTTSFIFYLPFPQLDPKGRYFFPYFCIPDSNNFTYLVADTKYEQNRLLIFWPTPWGCHVSWLT